MNATISTSIRLGLSVLCLLFSVFVLMIALVSIQAMSGSEPFREPLTFFTIGFALAFELGATCSLPLTGRYRAWPTALAFTSGGAVGGAVLASGLALITGFERQLRALTDGGPLGIFLLAATVVALATPFAVGMSLLHMMTRRSGRLSV